MRSRLEPRELPLPADEEITITLTAALADAVRGAAVEGRDIWTAGTIREAVRERRHGRNLLGFSAEALRRLAQERDASGDRRLGTLDEVKAAARQRLQS